MTTVYRIVKTHFKFSSDGCLVTETWLSKMDHTEKSMGFRSGEYECHSELKRNRGNMGDPELGERQSEEQSNFVNAEIDDIPGPEGEDQPSEEQFKNSSATDFAADGLVLSSAKVGRLIEDDPEVIPPKKRAIEVDSAISSPGENSCVQHPTTSSPLQDYSNTKNYGSRRNSELDPIRVERSQFPREKKESKLFRKLINERFSEWRLQEGPCAVNFYSPCISCSLHNWKRGDNNDCRFYNRMLRSAKDPKTCRRITISDLKEILPELPKAGVVVDSFDDTLGIDGEKPNGRDAQIAAYILQCTKTEFERVVFREQKAIQLSKSVNVSDQQAFFSHSYQVKQICDVCHFSILNAHFCCIVCGTELCTVCFNDLREQRKSFSKWMKKVPCLDNNQHEAASFHLGSFLPTFDTFRSLQIKIEEQFDRYKIKDNGAVCNGNHGRKYFQQDKCYCPRQSDPSTIKIERICIIKDQLEPEAYAQFKAHIAVHHPIIVENVDKHPKFVESLWNREAFEKIIGS